MTTNVAADAGPAPANRTMIVISVMLASMMTALDTTIANVALPHMAGSVSASGDQIAWVLTSYIVATAIVTPMTGWLTNKFGGKLILLVSVAGFVSASALCGAAQNLSEIVAFRVLQGVFAAPIMPLGQAMMLDLYSVAERGRIMAVWGIGVMVAPIAGPVLGGWLTDVLNWRWVFYINLPIGALCLLGIVTSVPETARQDTKFDLKGFAMLSIALAAMQIMFDRGEGQGWFGSHEIVVEGVIALIALWFFAVHSSTSANPFLPLQIFKDRNFVTASALTLLTGVAVLSVSALVPSMLQTLYGYSVISTGWIVAPRGIGAVFGLALAGNLVGRIDTRLLIMFGLTTFAATFFGMSQFTLDTSPTTITVNSFVQGFGTPFVFLPTTTMAFATLAPKFRADAAAITALVRYIGGSVGISGMLALIANFSVAARGALVIPYSVDNPNMAGLPANLSLVDPVGVATLSHEVDRQATMVAYSQVFMDMTWIVIAMIPLLFFMRPPPAGPTISQPLSE